MSAAGGHESRVRVFVADGFPVTREGASSAIRRQSDLELVGVAEGGAQALEGIRELRPDVALLDAELPELDGLAIVAALASDEIPTRVVLFSSDGGGAVVHAAISAGAAGYLTKAEPLRAIVDAIRTVARDGRYVSSEAQSALLVYLQLRETVDRPLLTDRELDILALTADGLSSSEIGRRLFLSQSTVKNHQHHMYDKLGVSKAPAAVREAIRRRLIA
jgi:two-component system nitrate/nitrite response regulator NarL